MESHEPKTGVHEVPAMQQVPQQQPQPQLQQPSYEFAESPSPVPQYTTTAYPALAHSPPPAQSYAYTQPAPQSPGAYQQPTAISPQFQQPQQQGIPMQQQFHPQQVPQAGAGTGFGAPQQQQHQPGRTYQNATPLATLNRGAAPVDCPACGQRAMTRVSYMVGNTTHVWAAALCCLFCLGCVPYLMDSLKDVEHHCGNCGVLLATWHRSGATEVHQHA